MDKVVRVLCPVGIQAGEFPFEGLHEGVLDVLVQEQVVRGNAGLAAVEALAPGDTPGGNGQVRLLVHDTRALAAEFQDHGRQVLRLGLHGNLPEGRAAGQEHKVIAVLEQFRVHRAVSLDHGHEILFEGIFHEFFQYLGHRGNIGRRLQNGRTARRDGAHERVQQQLDRVVPGRHDERAAQWFPDDVGGRRHHGHRRGNPAPAGPSAHLPGCFPDLSVNDADFGHVGLLITLVKVRPQGVAKGLFPLFEPFVELEELEPAPVHVARDAGREERPLPADQFFDSFGGGVFESHNVTDNPSSRMKGSAGSLPGCLRR